MHIVKIILRWLGKVILACVLISLALTLLYRFIPVYYTPLMLIRSIEQMMDEKREVKLKKEWVHIDHISRHMTQAVIAAEDQKFLLHYGFDTEAILKALEGNRSGANIKGGSTISNQTAKNVFLWPGRNYLRKGLEAYFTVLIEVFWSKERIIEVYLNVIETGDGIYGVEAAAQTFYNKSAENLTRNEAAMIAAVLPNPLRWSPSLPTAYNYQRQAWILRNMGNLQPSGFGK
jgi:monofunctional biosynthetic peptidoglycan transglycosylase